MSLVSSLVFSEKCLPLLPFYFHTFLGREGGHHFYYHIAKGANHASGVRKRGSENGDVKEIKREMEKRK